MITTFTYKLSLVRIQGHSMSMHEDRCTQFRVIVETDAQTDRGDYNTLRRSLVKLTMEQ